MKTAVMKLPSATSCLRALPFPFHWSGTTEKDGSIIQALLSVSLVRDAKGAPERVIGQFVDLSEQKKLEQELSRGERLQTVGRMAAGAYDFNNLLTVIEAEIGTWQPGRRRSGGKRCPISGKRRTLVPIDGVDGIQQRGCRIHQYPRPE